MSRWILALPLLAACGLLDTVGSGRDPRTGECPVDLPTGAAAGEDCDSAEDCAGTCCACDNGATDYVAAACVDNKCMAADEVCSYVADHQSEACDPPVIAHQEADACPATLATGGAEGDSCDGAQDCAGVCCTCDDGVTTFEAQSCDDDECPDQEHACEQALDEYPDLCP